MSYLAAAVDPRTQSPRSRMFWLVLGAVAAGQLFAFWLLCSHQVRKAEARHNELTVNQMALADCLQYIPGSTIASCTGQVENASHVPQRAGAKPAVAGALPVSYSYR